MTRMASNAVTQGFADMLAQSLQLYGHRNWIAITDMAYPCQSSPAITTTVTTIDQLTALELTFKQLDQCAHVRPVVYVDSELDYVSNDDAPGVDAFRADVKELLAGRPVIRQPHDEIITALDAAADQFCVLIIKTPSRLPYTSMFINLDCGYWSPEAEERLRRRIKADVKG